MSARERGRRSFHALVLVCGLGASGCDDTPSVYRGAGLQVDTLPVDEVAAVYRAVLAASFTLDDPNLSLLADRLLLPRTAGLVGGDTMSPELLATLQRRRIVLGTCQMPIRETRVPLICRAEQAGYVVRFSNVFSLAGEGVGTGGGRDSVQVNLAVQQYAIPNGPMAERLRFERAYHVARRGSAWRAVREARMPLP